jgi:hypothetical protein
MSLELILFISSFSLSARSNAEGKEEEDKEMKLI